MSIFSVDSTPVELESREWNAMEWNGKYESENNCWKVDLSPESFLFSLDNPDNFLERRFALKAEKKDEAADSESD
jgi:hypothetical protein